jgi:tetrahydromethanopterin S-methyltransferase subunit A
MQLHVEWCTLIEREHDPPPCRLSRSCKMTPEVGLQTIRTELEAGIQLTKCQQCGCMEDTLTQLATVLPTIGTEDASSLVGSVEESLTKIRPRQYECLGCEHCYPAVASNALHLAYPELDQVIDVACDFRVRDEQWPPVVGEYVVLDAAAPVAVSTLASVQLAEDLGQHKPHGLAIVGKTETENIGIDKVVKNVITNPSLQYLIVAGLDAQGHHPGTTLLALAAHGVDDTGRVRGSPGIRPILRNVSVAEIQAFRDQVEVVDMRGCESLDEIAVQIEALAQHASTPCGCSTRSIQPPGTVVTAPTLMAPEPCGVVTLDKAGYFVIVPQAGRGVITVEHYAYDNMLLRVIEGTHARAIYTTLINKGWVTELSHAAYLGKELAKAELSLHYRFKYVQDGA